MEGGSLAVRPDRQHRRRGLNRGLASQAARIDPVALHRVDDEVPGRIFTEGTHSENVHAELCQVNTRAGGRTGHSEPNLLEQIKILFRRNTGHRSAEHVENVDSKADYSTRVMGKGTTREGTEGHRVIGAETLEFT